MKPDETDQEHRRADPHREICCRPDYTLTPASLARPNFVLTVGGPDAETLLFPRNQFDGAAHHP
jgi:hypothetical protein